MVFRRPAGRDSGLSSSSCMCHHLNVVSDGAANERAMPRAHVNAEDGRPAGRGALDPGPAGLDHACVMGHDVPSFPSRSPCRADHDGCWLVLAASDVTGRGLRLRRRRRRPVRSSCMACPIRSSSSSWATGLAFLCVVATVWE